MHAKPLKYAQKIIKCKLPQYIKARTLWEKNHPKEQTVNRRGRQPSREAERLQELQGSKLKFHSLI